MNSLVYAFLALTESPLATSSVIALLLATITLWCPTRFRLPILFFIIYLILGLFSTYIHLIALPAIFLLAFLYFVAQAERFNTILRLIAGISAFALTMGFFFHLLPGITNIKVIDQEILSRNGTSFTMYFNLDTPLVGLFILFFGRRLIQNAKQWKDALLETLPIALIGFFIILGLSIALNFVTFEPKFNSIFYIWVVHNLFFTAVTEEALCRGFVLRYMDICCQRLQYGQYISLLIVSLFFGALHYKGGWQYMLLASVAGMVYGRVYQKTRRIEASIITHFVLNTIHFLLFTYPALIQK